MAWSTSKLFRQYFSDILGGTILNQGAGSTDLDLAGALKAALYDNTITPDGDATAIQSAYAGAGGVWSATGGGTGSPQVYHAAGGWNQGGVTLTGTTLSVVAGGVVQFTSANIASGASATMSNIYGMLIYVDALTTPVADQGLGFWYFGGTAYSVTSGTLTIQPNASGLFRLTV